MSKPASKPAATVPRSHEEIAAELMGTPRGRRAYSAASPAFFDSYYCGMYWAAHRSEWLRVIDATIKRSREHGQAKSRLLLLAPRDHGKTEVVLTVALREICLNRDIRILFISESADVAKKRLLRLSGLLDSLKITQDWASAPEAGCVPFRPIEATAQTKWTQTQIYVQRHKRSVDPTVEAVGSGGSLTGGHFDLILCDDLESDKTTLSAAQRAKTRAWFRATVTPMLSPGGSMIVIGTRKHHDDLYAHLKASSAWRVIEDPAIIQWPEAFKVIRRVDALTGAELISGVEHTGPHQVLWPEREVFTQSGETLRIGRPLVYLLAEREEITHLLFQREFQHKVQDDSAAPFRMDWLTTAMERGATLSLGRVPEGLKGLEIVQGWDLSLVTNPAKAAAHDTDYTVGVTWARDANGDRYLLGIKRFRGVSPGQLRGKVIAEFERFGGLSRVRAVAVEKNAFGELHYLGLQRSYDLPLKGHLTTKAKADPWDGVPSLSALFENGKVVLPSRTEDDRAALAPLIQELWGLGTEAHDDTVMSLWIAETVLRKGVFVHHIGDESFEAGEAFGDDYYGDGLGAGIPTRGNAGQIATADAEAIWGSMGSLIPGFGSGGYDL